MQSIRGLFGTAQVDLFVSETSTHWPTWFSLIEKTKPLGQDALAHKRSDCLHYAFPSLPIILSTLLRVLYCGHFWWPLSGQPGLGFTAAPTLLRDALGPPQQEGYPVSAGGSSQHVKAITSAKCVGEIHALSVSDTCPRWNPDSCGVTPWPNTAFLPKVLACSHLNQPIQLGQFDPPSGRSQVKAQCTP